MLEKSRLSSERSIDPLRLEDNSPNQSADVQYELRMNNTLTLTIMYEHVGAVLVILFCKFDQVA